MCHDDHGCHRESAEREQGRAPLVLDFPLRCLALRIAVIYGHDSFSSLVQHFIEIQHQVGDHCQRRQLAGVERAIGLRFAHADQLLGRLRILAVNGQVILVCR